MCRAVLLQVLQGIPQGHPMLLQKRMHPETGPVAEQAPQLLLVQLAGLVPGQCQAFQHTAGYVLPPRLNLLGDIVWQMNRDFHTPLSAHRPSAPLYRIKRCFVNHDSRKIHGRQCRGPPPRADGMI